MGVERYEEIRDHVAEYIRRELIGPVGGQEEILGESPTQRYVAGILYPKNSGKESAVRTATEDIADQGGDSGPDSAHQDQSDQSIELANQLLPSALGLSFFLSETQRIEVAIDASRYEKDKGVERGKRDRPRFRRIPMSQGWTSPTHILGIGRNNGSARLDVLQGNASLHSTWRKVGSGWLVTVSLTNNKTGRPDKSPTPEECLFQVGLRCRLEGDAGFGAMPRTELLTSDPEEKELELLYRHHLPYSNGHGCAVSWDFTDDGTRVTEVRTAIIPDATVPAVTYEREGLDTVLRLSTLADTGVSDDEMIAQLRVFADLYASWIAALPDANLDIPSHLLKTRDELLGRLSIARDRIGAGIDLLEEDPIARRAFRLANRAMLLQMALASDEYSGTRRKAGSFTFSMPNLDDFSDRPWRPFQLGFMLLTLPSVINVEHPDRDLCDLIWFPTGGGKTEAYLAVSAFLIFYRRLRWPQGGGGTAILMRYTLQLLTTQQFRRAAGMVLSCELMRREIPQELGAIGVSIGLWIGGSATPNTFQKAKDDLDKILADDKPRSPYRIDSCPCCGSWLFPEHHSDNPAAYGVEAGDTFHRLRCPTESCPFHEFLPIRVVDEALYQDPPTLLIATVDKFADLPWNQRPSVFFGGEGMRQPDLIIQDELHLISGPLGSIVGNYEAAIDGLIKQRGGAPKIIASTATIRSANPQVLALFDRRTALFPPAGLDVDDSWFATTDFTKPGRMYLGVLTSGTSASTAYVRTAAALLQAPREIAVDLNLDDKETDAYWTLVSYFNSLRELGRAVTFADDDIPDRLLQIASDVTIKRELGRGSVRELTSNLSGSSGLTELLTNLEYPHTNDRSVSLLLCTNMISVGVDVPRLALMLVNNQPKSTSEYIQATSRVGRSNVPGLVVTLFSSTKPRDRSHYERFVSFHRALYRGVEPTSVTPFSPEARDRALHAALVSLVRHGQPINEASEIAKFENQVRSIIRILVERVNRIDPDEANRVNSDLEARFEEWRLRAEEEPHLRFATNTRQSPSLLRDYRAEGRRGWPTLRSMRSVDASCEIVVKDGPR